MCFTLILSLSRLNIFSFEDFSGSTLSRVLAIWMATMNRPSGSRELMMNYGKFKVIRKSGKIRKNQEKSGKLRKIRENQEKSGKISKIRKNQEKSGKIRKNQKIEIRKNQEKSEKIRFFADFFWFRFEKSWNLFC